MSTASFTLTMRSALNRVAKGRGLIVWHLENTSRNHRLPGLAYTSREAAMTDKRLADFPEYVPCPYLKAKGVERRWQTGQGRAGGDVRVAHNFYFLTPII